MIIEKLSFPVKISFATILLAQNGGTKRAPTPKSLAKNQNYLTVLAKLLVTLVEQLAPRW